jgi:hypothetical protein
MCEVRYNSRSTSDIIGVLQSCLLYLIGVVFLVVKTAQKIAKEANESDWMVVRGKNAGS